MRDNDHETAAKLLCRVQIGWWGDVSTAVAIFSGDIWPRRWKKYWYLFLYSKLILLNKYISKCFFINQIFAAIVPSFCSQSHLAANYSYVIFCIVKVEQIAKHHRRIVKFEKTFPLHIKVQISTYVFVLGLVFVQNS